MFEQNVNNLPSAYSSLFFCTISTKKMNSFPNDINKQTEQIKIQSLNYKMLQYTNKSTKNQGSVYFFFFFWFVETIKLKIMLQ